MPNVFTLEIVTLNMSFCSLNKKYEMNGEMFKCTSTYKHSMLKQQTQLCEF